MPTNNDKKSIFFDESIALTEVLLTCDGQGKKAKQEALDRLKEIWWEDGYSAATEE